MNAKRFSDAMSELDSKYIDEALNYKKKAKNPVWVKWGVMAASFCLIVAAVITIPSMLNSGGSDDEVTDGIAGGEQNISEKGLQFPDNIQTIEVTYLVYSSEISRELSQDEIIAVKEWAASLEWEETPLNETETPDNYAGGIQWKFNVNNGELTFSYVDYGASAIFIDNEWYAVKNPSNPPVEVN